MDTDGLMFMLLFIVVVTIIVVGLIKYQEHIQKNGAQTLRPTLDGPGYDLTQNLQQRVNSFGLLGPMPKVSRNGCLIAVALFVFIPPFRWLVWLALALATPFIPLALMAGALRLAISSSNRGVVLGAETQSRLGPLLENDANFSLPVFREFAVLLYSQAIQERMSNFSHSRPYLTDSAAQTLARRGKALSVTDVVVGTCSLEAALVQGGNLQLRVRFESNYLENTGSDQQAFVAEERWTFSRKLGSLTQIPEGATKLACPGCGFSGDFPSSGECPQCNRTNQQGQLDWVVTNIQVLNLETFTPHQAEGGGVEAGTNLPTIVHPQLGVRRRELEARHPDFQLSEFEQKVREVFLAINQAWNDRDWAKARPYETDALFRTHRYWIEDYLRRGQINQLGQIQLSQVVLSNIVLDAFYESITVRLYASMTDCTVDAKSGKVLFGDSKRARSFTEYWTFIRRVGSKSTRGTTSQCPSCGASLDRVNQAGICEYCDSLITKGDFGWVLSNIEQDEVYRPSC